MTADDILLSGGDRIATDAITEATLTRHVQRATIEATGSFGTRAPAVALYRYLRVDGGDAGSFDMAVDGSGGIDFEYIVPASKIARISRITGYLTDAGSMTAATFGVLTALSNGCTVKALDSDDAVLKDFLDGDTLTTNADFSVLAGPDALSIASVLSIIPIRWSLTKDLGGKELVLTAGQKLQFKTQDDLSGLVAFQLMVKGVEIDA